MPHTDRPSVFTPVTTSLALLVLMLGSLVMISGDGTPTSLPTLTSWANLVGVALIVLAAGFLVVAFVNLLCRSHRES